MAVRLVKVLKMNKESKDPIATPPALQQTQVVGSHVSRSVS